MTEVNILAVKLEALHNDVGDVKAALHKLSDAITKLALVEQQQSQTVSALERAFKAISKIEERVSSLESIRPKSEDANKWIDRALTGLIVIAVGLILEKIGLVL